MNKVSLRILILFLALSACSPLPVEQSGQIKVVATTTIVGDIVFQVGGEQIDLTILLPAGTDPHSFQATPQDLATISDADIVFLNGLGLEEFLDSILDNVGGEVILVSLSDGLPNLLKNEDSNHDHGDADHEHDEATHEHDEADHDHEGFDPHVWLNPNNIGHWVGIIQEQLSEIDPKNSEVYLENTTNYLQELETLDNWLAEQTEYIPAEKRIMVADHHAWGYFADAYGFELIGTIIPGYSTLAEASAGDLAELEELIEQFDVRTIFIGNSINPGLATQIAKDTGIEIASLFTGSLSKANGPAPNYLEMMRHNMLLILEAFQ